MSEPVQYTPQRTKAHAFMFAHVLRVLFQANRATMGDRWSHLGIELQHALRPIVNGATSVPEAIDAICSRWSLATNTERGVLHVEIPREMARVWSLQVADMSDEEIAVVAWHRIVPRLDIDRVRAAVNASPQIFAALTREYVGPEDRRVFAYDLSFFDWIRDGAASAVPVDIADFEPPVRYWAQILLRSPLAHGGDAVGSNITPMRREDRVDLHTGQVHAIPFVAGNAVRGLLRDIATYEYLAALDLVPQKIRPDIAHSLLAGGMIAAGETMGATDNELRAKIRRLCPVLDLFGGCVESQLMQGVLLVGDAILVCRETAAMVAPAMGWSAAVAAELAPSLPRADACLCQRHSIRKHHPEISGESTQMIMHTEALAAGHLLAHDLAFRTPTPTPTPVQGGMLVRTLQRARELGFLGGKNQAGFGQVSWGTYCGLEDTTAAFDAHMAAIASEARAWLIDGFPPTEKPAGKRGKKGASDAAVAS